MSLTGDFVDAAEALRIGLANHVVAHHALAEFTGQLAGRITDNPAGAEIIDLYRRSAGTTLAEALALEADYTSRRSFDPAAFERRGHQLTGEPGAQPHDLSPG
jgi:enoyl-CoA hydratase